MRAAMAAAEVGDDERDGDPTTRRLEERVAALLGKEAALFFPSGVMANQAAVWMHSPRGTEVLADVDAHIVHSEIAGIAALSGAQVLAVRPVGLVMSADDLRARFGRARATIPAASLVCVENTHNGAGGRSCRCRQTLQGNSGGGRGAAACRCTWTARGSGTRASRRESRSPSSPTPADTVMVAFSKGLGAPIGAAIAGTRGGRWSVAWTARKLFGGAMRQSGILAAAVLYALDHHIDAAGGRSRQRARVGADHRRRRRRARRRRPIRIS